MRNLFAHFSILACLCAPAAAQGLVFDMSATDACLASAHGAASGDCLGASAAACMEATEGGNSTVGMGACIEAELEVWDARLNDAYRARLAEHEAADAEFKPPLPEAEALRAAQRAWIPWRDANCEYEYSHWGGGTGGGPASRDCVMRMTAHRALELNWTPEDSR